MRPDEPEAPGGPRRRVTPDVSFPSLSDRSLEGAPLLVPGSARPLHGDVLEIGRGSQAIRSSALTAFIDNS